MALSKEEQTVLDDIEQGLRQDPQFAAGLDAGRVRRVHRRRAVTIATVGALLLLLGEMLTLTAVVAGVAISVVGFLSMLVACAWGSLPAGFH